MDIIDSKKIVEASEKYAKEMEETCKKLAKKYKSSTSLCNWVTVNPEAAFQNGINWFLKNLWHPNTEEPEENRNILIEHKCGDLLYHTENYDCYYEDPWDAKVRILNITRWFYIDDLFPKEGGNYD